MIGADVGARTRVGTRGLSRMAALLLAFLPTAACNIELASNDPPRRARVVITSSSGAQANLLASLDFVVDAGGGVNTGSATSSLVTLPFEQTYDLLDPPRLFVRVTPPDSLSDLGVSLDVFFDGEPFSSQSDTIGTTGRPALEFLYRFSRPTH